MSWEQSSTDEAPEYTGAGALEEGQYGFLVEKVELKTSNASGNKYINFWLEEVISKRKVFYPIYASADYDKHKNQQWAQSQWNCLKRLFMVSGVTPPTSKPTPSDLQTLKDTFIDAKVIIEQDQNGKDQNKVADVFPYTGEKVKEVIGQVVNDEMSDDIPF